MIFVGGVWAKAHHDVCLLGPLLPINWLLAGEGTGRMDPAFTF